MKYNSLGILLNGHDSRNAELETESFHSLTKNGIQIFFNFFVFMFQFIFSHRLHLLFCCQRLLSAGVLYLFDWIYVILYILIQLRNWPIVRLKIYIFHVLKTVNNVKFMAYVIFVFVVIKSYYFTSSYIRYQLYIGHNLNSKNSKKLTLHESTYHNFFI